MNNIILELQNISKTYKLPKNSLEVLKNANLQINEKEKIAIVGESGSGKSTFLHIASLLDDFDNGKIFFNGNQIDNISDKEKSKIRNKNFGFVYQSHMLLNEFTIIENVLMPILIERSIKKKDKDKALDLLSKLNIQDCANKYPLELSGGQQQRVAIARSLIQSPKVVFADEPTGNLDPETALIVRKLFNQIIQEEGTSLIIVTHDMNLAETCDIIYKLENKTIQKI